MLLAVDLKSIRVEVRVQNNGVNFTGGIESESSITHVTNENVSVGISSNRVRGHEVLAGRPVDLSIAVLATISNTRGRASGIHVDIKFIADPNLIVVVGSEKDSARTVVNIRDIYDLGMVEKYRLLLSDDIIEHKNATLLDKEESIVSVLVDTLR
jgi:hypothetical protein